MTELITGPYMVYQEYCMRPRRVFEPKEALNDTVDWIYKDTTLYEVGEFLSAVRETDDAEVIATAVMIQALMKPDRSVLRLRDAIEVVFDHDREMTGAFVLQEVTSADFGMPLPLAAFARMAHRRLPYSFRVEHSYRTYYPLDDEPLIAFMAEHDLPGLAAFLRLDEASVYWFEDLGAAVMGKLQLGDHDRG